MTNNFSIGRNPLIEKAVIFITLVFAGGLWFNNVHASSVAMQDVATLGSMGVSVPVAAGDGLAGLALRYVSAFGVSLACFMISGIVFHPAGLATVFRQIRNVEAKGGSKAIGLAVTTVVSMILVGFGVWAYYYDLMTTALAFGVTSLWSLAAFPVWLNVIGPEFFFHTTHWYGQLTKQAKAAPAKAAPAVAGKAPGASAMPGRPPAPGGYVVAPPAPGGYQLK
jgi:hypothetical protein